MPSHKISPMKLLIRREVTDLLRDWRLSLPGISFSFVIPVLIFLGVRFLSLQGEAVSAQISMKAFFPISVLIVSFFPSALTVVVALESFVGERERNTLESLLLTPIRDSELYIGKLLSSVVPPLALGIISTSVYYGLCAFFMRTFIPLWLLGVIYLLVVIKSVVLVSGASVISSQSKTVRASNLSSTLIVFPVTILLGLEAQLLMKNEYFMLMLLIIALLIYATLFVRTGMRIFNRENLLVHEQSVDSLKGTLVMFFMRFKAMLFKDKPLSVKSFARDIVELFRAEKKNIIFMSAVFFISIFSGFYFAQFLVGEAPALALKQTFGETAKLPEELTFFYFARHNIRALFLVCLLAPFTFGTSGIAFIFVPGAMIGFLCGMEKSPSWHSIAYQLSFLFPHALFEIPATVLGAVFAFRLGTVLLTEKKSRSFFDRYMQSAADTIKIFIIVIPLFLIAAYLESHHNF